MAHRITHERSGTIFFGAIAFFVLTTTLVLSFLYAQISDTALSGDSFFWFGLSFVTGVMTIFLPCTLPLAFIAIPSSKDRRLLRSLGMILLFTLGVSLILSFYGGVLGALGSALFSGFPVGAMHAIIPWVYLLGGIFAYILSLGELGLISLRMPSYGGTSPQFIRSQKGARKMFYMGMFLGNIGVGCPFPVMPLLLVGAVLSGSVSFGALLFLVHALGRVLPLFVLFACSILRIDGLAWLIKNKERFDRTNGWVFVVFTAFLITVGLYSYQWLYGTQAYLWLTTFFSILNPLSAQGTSHLSFFEGVSNITNQGASTLFLALILVPLWWSYVKERFVVFGSAHHQAQVLLRKVERILEEQRGHEAVLHIPEGRHHERVRDLDRQIDLLLTERKILEESMRYSDSASLRSKVLQRAEERAVLLQRNWYITLTLLLVLLVSILL